MTPNREPRLDDDAVAEFLANNADFFARRPELVPDIDAMHTAADGTTVVPLAERQVAVLRQRNAALRKRMAALLANAQENERTFAAMRGLTLALMDASSAEDLGLAIGRHLVDALDVDHAVCFLQGRVEADSPHLAGIRGEPPLPRLFAHTEPKCSALRSVEYQRLFPGATPTGPGSVALVPLAVPPSAGTLAIGAEDPERFTPDMGKLFLSFLGDVMSRGLRRMRPSG